MVLEKRKYRNNFFTELCLTLALLERVLAWRKNYAALLKTTLDLSPAYLGLGVLAKYAISEKLPSG